MTTPAAQRKATERQRHRDAGRVVVQVWIFPDDRVKLARYIKRLNDQHSRSIKEAARKIVAAQQKKGQ